MSNLTPSQANIITYFAACVIVICWISYYLIIKRNKRLGYVIQNGTLKLSKAAHVFLTIVFSVAVVFLIGFLILFKS